MPSSTQLQTVTTGDASKSAFDVCMTSGSQMNSLTLDNRQAINPRTTKSEISPDGGYGPQTTGSGITGTPNDAYGSVSPDGAVVASGKIIPPKSSATSVNSVAISPSPAPPPPTVSPTLPTATAAHKSSIRSTATFAGGLSSIVFLCAVLVFVFLRRRRHRRSTHLRVPPELDPEPFDHINSAYTIHRAEQSTAAEVCEEGPRANAVEHKTWSDGFVRHGASTLRSAVVAPSSTQNTNEKQPTRLMPPGEETVVPANIYQQENTREALLEQEVVALRMRIRAMEDPNSEDPGRDYASVSESEAPPGYEDVEALFGG